MDRQNHKRTSNKENTHTEFSSSIWEFESEHSSNDTIEIPLDGKSYVHEKSLLQQKNRIILMSKMALYDKHFAKEDIQKEQFFAHDYVYRQNMWLRFFVFLGCLVLVFFYAMYQFSIKKVDMMNIDYQNYVIKMIVFFVAVMVVYSIWGTIIQTKALRKTKRRMEQYKQWQDELLHINKKD